MDNLKKCEEFEDMSLKMELLRGIFQYGFEKPSEIQKTGIPAINTKKDCIIQAQSGMGKTGTFAIGLLNNIAPLKGTQTLVLSPTRELCDQTYNVINSISSYQQQKNKIKIHKSRGGTSTRDDRYGLQNKPEIVIGCPGRVVDMIERRNMYLRDIKCVCLDEADQLLDRGFIEQVKFVLQSVPENVQIVLVSATMPNEVLNLTKQFMRNPIEILVESEKLSLDGINQYFVNVLHDDNKFITLLDLYSNLSISQAIIYCNEISKVEFVTRELLRENFTVSKFHAHMRNEERKEIMESFRNGDTRVLVTTDLLARGIDVQQVSLVINYDFPMDSENYLHRIGRSGRYGRKGVAINFTTNSMEDIERVKKTEEIYKIKLEELPSDLDTL